MSEIVTLLLVASAIPVITIGLVWWSCRAAPPVKSRGITIGDMMKAAAARFETFRETMLRITVTGQVTVQDIRRLSETMRKKP